MRYAIGTLAFYVLLIGLFWAVDWEVTMQAWVLLLTIFTALLIGVIATFLIVAAVFNK